MRKYKVKRDISKTIFLCVKKNSKIKFSKGLKKEKKMPADIMWRRKLLVPGVAATPASVNTTPDKPKTASEHRKVRAVPVFPCTPRN